MRRKCASFDLRSAMRSFGLTFTVSCSLISVPLYIAQTTPASEYSSAPFKGARSEIPSVAVSNRKIALRMHQRGNHSPLPTRCHKQPLEAKTGDRAERPESNQPSKLAKAPNPRGRTGTTPLRHRRPPATRCRSQESGSRCRNQVRSAPAVLDRRSAK